MNLFTFLEHNPDWTLSSRLYVSLPFRGVNITVSRNSVTLQHHISEECLLHCRGDASDLIATVLENFDEEIRTLGDE